MPNYPELGKIESTDEQHLGLEIAYKTAVNAGGSTVESPGLYLAERVIEILNSYVIFHVTDEIRKRVWEALARATEQQILDVARDLGIDLVVIPPADVVKADAGADALDAAADREEEQRENAASE